MQPYVLIGVALGASFCVVAIAILLELLAAFVYDPDGLAIQTGLEVYCFPPLPTADSSRTLDSPSLDEKLELFMQRLDHLWFAVCGNTPEQRRCVLITSAINREGKTTLAAQLAARCGRLRMSTLLIEADFRRPVLPSVLDIPDCPGLGDALLYDMEPADLIVPIHGGTFGLLPAGSPIPDACRALVNPKFGSMIARFRQIYDVIIIDSPPVLPVPDALILGRWADCALLSTRHDFSRFPQVKEALHQLDSAGITVLGIVLNGLPPFPWVSLPD